MITTGTDILNHIKKNRKNILRLTSVTVLLILILVFADVKEYKERFVIEDGNIVAVKEDSGVVSLILKQYGDDTVDEDLTLDTKQIKRKTSKKDEEDEDKESSLINLFNSVRTSKELREGGFIILPEALENGKELKWQAKRDFSFLYLVMIIPLFIFFDYRSDIEKIKKRQEAVNDSIIKCLPGFNNSLILLLESGLIFEDAFYRIASGYESRSEKSFFENFIVEVKNEAGLTGRDYISILNADAVRMKNRDLSRLGSVLADSRNKGVSIAEKLINESEYLWEERKKHASEKSKKAEIRMTQPLGILLLSLILITASPAILQI